MLKREEAHDIGLRIVEMLAPVCERVEIAGSIRRRLSFVNDIEVVCQPIQATGSRPRSLFADCPATDKSRATVVDRLIDRTCAAPGPLQFDAELPRNDSRYKRLIWAKSVKIDLFVVVPPATWGAVFAIRTGPAEFGHLLVTKREFGGALPPSPPAGPSSVIDRESSPQPGPLCGDIWQPSDNHMRQEKGALWIGNETLPAAEEEDFFAALGLPTWAPWDRSVARLLRFLNM